jgi:hypothetical protein
VLVLEPPPKARMKILILCFILIVFTLIGGCISCIPQYTAPPDPPVSAHYPVGQDPYIPMDHNPSVFNFWDVSNSVLSPFMYGPPR